MDHPIRRIQDMGPPKYDVDEENFSVILHYKGAMCLDGYYGGEVDCFDWCKLDSISLSVFDRWIQELCGDGYVRYFYKPNGYVYRGSLRPLDSESDVFEMCLAGGRINRQIDVYVNHFTEDIVAELYENGSPYRYVQADEEGEKDVDVDADLAMCVDVPSGQQHEEPEDYSSKICWMSDRQKGLINAVHDLFPESEHRNCVRHIYQNLREKFKGKTLKDMVWNAARATSLPQFKKAMDLLKKENEDAFNWLEHPDRPYHSWTRSLFKTHTKCDMLLNNLCECFNRYILDERDIPIITMLEMIKSKLMKRMHNKSEMIKKCTSRICLKIEKKFKKIRDSAGYFDVEKSGGARVQVNGIGGPFIVDLANMTCTCRRWELTGLPCPHATASLLANNDDLYNYLNEFYSVETFKKVYSNFINRNPHDHWPEVNDGIEVIPPKSKNKKRGRKPKAMRKQPEELEEQRAKKKVQTSPLSTEESAGATKLSKKGTVTIKCRVCGEVGHNARRHGNKFKTSTSRAVGAGTHPHLADEQNTQPDQADYHSTEELLFAADELLHNMKKSRPKFKNVMKGRVIPSRYKGQSSTPVLRQNPK